MVSISWRQTGAPFQEWTAFQSDVQIGSVERIDDTNWTATRVDFRSRTFFSKDAAMQWVENPEHPLMEF